MVNAVNQGRQLRCWTRPYVIAIGLLLTACGSAPSASPSGSTSSQANLGYVTAQIEKWQQLPGWQAPGPAFDARKAAGKKVFAIPTVSQVPFVVLFNQAQAEAARLAGVNYTSCDNNGTVSEWVKCVSEGTAQKPDVLQLSAPDPAELQPQIKQATDAGIPVLSTALYDPAIPKTPGITAWAYEPYQAAARLEVDWVIKETQGNADVVLVTSNELITSRYIMTAIADEFSKYCGSSCKTTTINVPISDWATRMQGATQSALLADPNVNYVLPIYDGMTQFVVPAIQTAHKEGKVHVATFNGTPFALKYIQEGDIVTMDVGQDLRCIGYSDMDPVFRVLAGVPPVDNTNYALRVITKANVNETGVPPVVEKGYGDACVNGFVKLWGLG